MVGRADALKGLAKSLLAHRRRYYLDRLFNRLGERKLAAFLRELGVRPGMLLYVQSSFGCLGYHPPGPEGLVRLLRRLVGPEGTVVMPSFPFRGTMAHFVEGRPVFDVRSSPSRVGALPEALRREPDAVRSLHPTHPVVAAGRHAAAVVEGHARTPTPQGPDSPFATLVDLDGHILRIGAGAYPFCHHLQELVDYPNLFLPEPVELECVSAEGRSVTVKTRVYRPKLPFVLFRDGADADDPVATNLVDFPYLHRGEREARMRARPELAPVLDRALSARARAVERGQLALGSINGCECDLFPIRESLSWATEEASRLLEHYSTLYEPSRLDRQELP